MHGEYQAWASVARLRRLCLCCAVSVLCLCCVCAVSVLCRAFISSYACLHAWPYTPPPPPCDVLYLLPVRSRMVTGAYNPNGVRFTSLFFSFFRA